MVLWTWHDVLCFMLRSVGSGRFTEGRSLSIECSWHANGQAPLPTRAFLGGFHETQKRRLVL